MGMTNQEAIKGLNNLFSEHELTLPCTDSLEILHMAVAALEKQIQKKPNNYAEISGSDGSTFEGDCPSCGAILCSEFDFCTDCGQAIDWSE